MRLNKTLTGILFASTLGSSMIGCKNEQHEINNFNYTLDKTITEVPLPSYRGAMGLAAADYDGDGDIDILTVKNYGKDKGSVSLYINEGGNYKLSGPIAKIPLPSYRGAMGLAAADYDGDGDIDILTVKNYGKDKGSVSLYINENIK